MSTHPLHANNFRREALSRGNVMTSPGKVISVFKLENLSRESPLAQLGWTQYLPVDGLHSPDGNYTYVYQLFTDSYRVIHTVVKGDDLPCSKLMPGEVQYLNHLLIKVGKDKPDMAELRFKASIFLGEELASIVNPFSFNAAIKNAIQRGYRLTPTQIEQQLVSFDNYSAEEIKFITERLGKVSAAEIAKVCQRPYQSIVTWANEHGFSSAFHYQAWSQDDENQLAALYQAGYSISQITEIMSRDSKRIVSRIAVLIASGRYPDMKPRPRGRMPKIKHKN